MDVTDNFTRELLNIFEQNTNKERAQQQKAYLKNQFAFFGLTSPQRKKLQAPFLVNKYLLAKETGIKIIKELYNQPKRELHYFAMELADKYPKKTPEEKDIQLYEWLITQNSWWDTVDFIAANIVGAYFIKYPEKQENFIKKWITSNNMWLQRTAIIHQLKYREKTNIEILSYAIENCLGSKEFFINKAIGWALRQYGKTKPDWVMEFVENHELAPLSEREALRIIFKNS